MPCSPDTGTLDFIVSKTRGLIFSLGSRPIFRSDRRSRFLGTVYSALCPRQHSLPQMRSGDAIKSSKRDMLKAQADRDCGPIREKNAGWKRRSVNRLVFETKANTDHDLQLLRQISGCSRRDQVLPIQRARSLPCRQAGPRRGACSDRIALSASAHTLEIAFGHFSTN